MYGLSIGAIMYADDLVLIAPTIVELQRMINLCSEELTLIDLNINVTKSACLRIGKNYNKTCKKLNVINNDIEWVGETKYLGIYITSSTKFVCNFSQCKMKYYRAANAILGKLGHQDNASSLLHLVSSIALPILTYGLEALAICKSQLIQLDHPWLKSCMKMFVTYDTSIIKQCQFFAGVLPIGHYYVIKCMSFWSKLALTNNNLLQVIYSMCKNKDLVPFANKYCCTTENILKHYSSIVTESFKLECV